MQAASRMIRVLSIALSIVSLVGCSTVKEDATAMRMPGEFEPQQAVWLAWDSDSAYHPTSLAMMRSLLPHVHIHLAVKSDSLLSLCRQELAMAGIDTAKVDLHVVPGADMWMRDCGATYVVENDSVHAVDFAWDNYAIRDWLLPFYDGDTAAANEEATRNTAMERGTADGYAAAAMGTPVITSWFRIEGGAIESNGKGTLILNEPLTFQRNHGVGRDSIAHELERVLGVTHIIWLPYGTAEDPHIYQTIAPGYFAIGCGGHTDQYVRFADARTVLLAWLPDAEKDANPVNRLNHEHMSANYDVLTKAVDQDGQPLRVIKVPMPDIRTERTVMLEEMKRDRGHNTSVSNFPASDGWAPGDSAWRVAAASYMNYFVSNEVVLLPSYVSAGSSAQKEEEVQRIFAEVFPGRRIVPLETIALNWDGGGIHCATQQIPKAPR